MASQRRTLVQLVAGGAVCLAAGLGGYGVGTSYSALAGIGPAEPRAVGARPVRSRGRRPDVVLITVDSLRADGVTCFGGHPGLTPAMDRLAARGTRFLRALTPTPVPGPAAVALLTGKLPGFHRRGERAGSPGPGPGSLPRGLVTLAEIFRDNGYRSGAFVSGPVLTQSAGFARGFDDFETVDPADGPGLVAGLERWATTIGHRQPRFVWLHVASLGFPYTPRPPWFERILDQHGMTDLALARSELDQLQASLAAMEPSPQLSRDSQASRLLRAAYLSEVASFDRTVSRILALLGEQWADTVVALVGAHGEELGERGRLGHGSSLYAEQIRVPLIISWPAQQPSGQVVREPVSTRSVFPTLLALARLPLPPDRGQLVRHGRLGPPRRKTVVSVLTGTATHLSSVAHGSTRLIVDHGTEGAELFDEQQDPDDGRDISGIRPHRARWLSHELQAILGRLESPTPDGVTR